MLVVQVEVETEFPPEKHTTIGITNLQMKEQNKWPLKSSKRNESPSTNAVHTSLLTGLS